ncbi:MAG TPA: hypothetical protein VLA61_03280 [Ideonella sp.]|uniref:hypothetical protein n=1 Tax=Ideonella sp. TaxID=1929293 RepID=UPI002C56A611|nr:hypothetical protein [Ideonella sp.]HSI47268.1 hypothetical protein [Ideonella sp.]
MSPRHTLPESVEAVALARLPSRNHARIVMFVLALASAGLAHAQSYPTAAKAKTAPGGQHLKSGAADLNPQPLPPQSSAKSGRLAPSRPNGQEKGIIIVGGKPAQASGNRNLQPQLPQRRLPDATR